MCYCQSKARQRHIAVSNTIVSCLPQANSGSYSQNLQALAVAINNQGNCQQPAALPKPSSTCHHLMLQPHQERPEITSGFIENKCFIYESVQLPLVCRAACKRTEPSPGSVHLHHHSGGVTKNQHLLCTIPITFYYRVTEAATSHLSKKAR